MTSSPTHQAPRHSAMVSSRVIWSWVVSIVLLADAVVTPVSSTVDATVVESFSREGVVLNRFVHLDHHVTYVAGTGKLYKFRDGTFNVEQEDDTNIGVTTMLLIHNNVIVICGTENEGRCEKRGRTDLGVPEGESKTFLTNGDASLSTVGLITQRGGIQALYIGTSLPNNNPADFWTFSAVNAMIGNDFSLVQEEPDEFDDRLLKSRLITALGNDVFGTEQMRINFVYVFEHENYIYFVQHQHDIAGNTGTRQMMSRICKDDNIFLTYVEIPIECSDSSYNISKAATRGVLNNEEVLLVLMSDGAQRNALCSFDMDTIVEQFAETEEDCHEENENVYISLRFGMGDDIGTTRGCASSLDVDVHRRCEQLDFSRYGTIAPLTGRSVLQGDTVATHQSSSEEWTAVALDGEIGVAFVGTSVGNVTKIRTDIFGSGREYAWLALDNESTEAVLSIDLANDNNDLLVLTADTLYKLKTRNCSLHTTCSACTRARDPYCGWCTATDRCSEESECSNSELSSRWLTDEGYCYSVDSVSPHSLTTSHYQITIRLDNLAPAVSSSETIDCRFSYTATRTAATVNNRRVDCPLPVGEPIPLPAGADNTTISIAVGVSAYDQSFVDTEFVYFDCGVHTRCDACTRASSAFACTWHILNNLCLHSHTTDTVTQPSECPLVESIDVTHIATGEETIITARGMEFPAPQGNMQYSCIVRPQLGSTMRVDASHISSSTIRCSPHRYSLSTANSTATVTVEWRTDSPSNAYEFSNTLPVVMYNCGALGTDCTSCQSYHDNPASGYNCIWCRGRCRYHDEATCSSDVTCESPAITYVSPLTLLHAGGTPVTIRGTNLGDSSEDVRVTINGAHCEVKEYTLSSSITCKSPASGRNTTPLTVNLRVSVSTGVAEFNNKMVYQTPEVSHVHPTLGPIAGGTILSINGSYLDTGRTKTVMIGDAVCVSSIVTSNVIKCETPAAFVPSGPHNVTIEYHKYEEPAATIATGSTFTYKEDPVIESVAPTIAYQGGGRIVTVIGTNLDTIVRPQMVVWNGQQRSLPSLCKHWNHDGTELRCSTPCVSSVPGRTCPTSDSRTRRQTQGNDIRLEFIFDNVENLTSEFDVVGNPRYKKFGDQKRLYSGDTLVLDGEDLDTACTKDEVEVKIGMVDCVVKSLSSTNLVCTPPEDQPAGVDADGNERVSLLPKVVVYVGDLGPDILGEIEYKQPTNELPLPVIIGIIAGGSFLIVVIIVIVIVYQRKSSAHERQYRKMQVQLDTLESNVRNECKQAFAELQTEVSDLTRDLTILGIPYWDYKTYTFKVLFPGHVRLHPVMQQYKQNPNAKNRDQGLLYFNQLINNRQFLLIFIRTLEAQQNFSIRDKAQVASLLMIVLFDKMDYATDILKALLNELIDKSVEKHPKLMLRRTESVVEKFLTNWLSICMYGYIKQHAGSSMFMLFKAIKQQTEKGPVDALTSEARYSLSEDRLLREKIDPKTLTIHLQTQGRQELLTCKVLDCDTITQTKDKCLDAMFKNTPFSRRPTVHSIDLKWKSGQHGRIPLQDSDVTTHVQNGWKRVNTLAHYNVTDGAVVSVEERTPDYDTLCREVNGQLQIGGLEGLINPVVTVEDGTKVWHLVKHDDGQQANRTQKAISEIFLTRLLSTKGTVQSFIDDLFETILTVDYGMPMAIKFLFDLLDNASRRHNIVDEEVVHVWKCNSLPLRFWVNMIKNPEFVFDIQKSHIIDSCLSVIAQTFMDACSTSEHRLGKDSPSNKLLFARDIPRYRKMVEKFFKDVQMMPAVTDAAMAASMTDLSMKNLTDFNVTSALDELYKYAMQYNYELYDALQMDVSAQKQQLAKSFEHVSSVIND